MSFKDRSRTVDHALDVLEALQGGGLLGVSEVARRLHLPKTVIHRLLSTLEDRRYIRQDAPSRRYALTLKLWQVGASAMRRADLPTLARDVLGRVVSETGETSYVSILDGLDVVWVAKVEGHEPLRVYVEVGGRVPAYCTASGKALLVYASDDVRAELAAAHLSKLTRRTITGVRELARELQTIRRRPGVVQPGRAAGRHRRRGGPGLRRYRPRDCRAGDFRAAHAAHEGARARACGDCRARGTRVIVAARMRGGGGQRAPTHESSRARTGAHGGQVGFDVPPAAIITTEDPKTCVPNSSFTHWVTAWE